MRLSPLGREAPLSDATEPKCWSSMVDLVFDSKDADSGAGSISGGIRCQMNMMNTRNRVGIHLAMCSLGLISCGVAADDNIKLRVMNGLAGPDPARAGDTHFEWRKQIRAGTFDSLADAVLSGAESFTKTIFGFEELKFVKAVTYTDASGDNMMAEWEADSGRTNLILRDIPNFSEYDIRTGPRVLHDAAELSAFLARILVTQKEPLHLKMYEFEVYVPSQTPAIVAFHGETIARSSISEVANVFIEGATDGKAWYVKVTLPKTYTRLFYPVPPYIPERFPPLLERLKTWSFDHILSEVGRPSNPPVFTVYRDGYLLAELARRGLSDVQVGDLLVDPSAWDLGERARVVLSALKKAGKDDPASRYYKVALDRYRQVGAAAEDAVAVFFADRATNCSPESETAATDALKDGAFFEGPLLYLSRCSASPETTRMLSGLSVPERFAQRKEGALSNMRQRLEHVAK